MSDPTLTSAAKVGAALDRLSVSVPGGASMKTSTDLIAAAAETIDTLTAERDRLLKLFDDAGQGEHNVLALVDKLHADIAQITSERDEARANYQFMVERAADQRLDGYRELGARAAAAEKERDAALARVAELEAHEMEVARISGIVHEADYHCHAGPRDQVLGEIERLKAEARDAHELRLRVTALEARPPHADEAPDYCWHCHLQLEPERPHCEECPPVCEDQDCPTCGGADLV